MICNARTIICILLLLCPQGIYAKSFAFRSHKKSQPLQSPYNLTAPTGWECIQDETQLPKKVKLLFIGKGQGTFAPSINLAMEETTLGLEEYVKLAKKYHESQSETICRPLGDIETKMGKASVLQIQRLTEWGDIRFLQASWVKEGMAYVITATAAHDEFANLYPDFYQAFFSFSCKQP
jgi:hypothetical protein